MHRCAPACTPAGPRLTWQVSVTLFLVCLVPLALMVVLIAREFWHEWQLHASGAEVLHSSGKRMHKDTIHVVGHSVLRRRCHAAREGQPQKVAPPAHPAEASSSSAEASMRPARCRAASTNCGSCSITKACKGVFVRERLIWQYSRSGASKAAIDGGGTVRFQKVYMLCRYSFSPRSCLYVREYPGRLLISCQRPAGW